MSINCIICLCIWHILLIDTVISIYVQILIVAIMTTFIEWYLMSDNKLYTGSCPNLSWGPVSPTTAPLSLRPTPIYIESINISQINWNTRTSVSNCFLIYPSVFQWSNSATVNKKSCQQVIKYSFHSGRMSLWIRTYASL